jgi:hypothetical protein
MSDLLTILCDRCKREVFKYETCTYCNKKIGVECMKSSQRHQKTIRLVICKDCWSNMKKRTAFKNRRADTRKIEVTA